MENGNNQISPLCFCSFLLCFLGFNFIDHLLFMPFFNFKSTFSIPILLTYLIEKLALPIICPTQEEDNISSFFFFFFFFLKKKVKYLFVPCGLKTLFFAFYALFCISNGTSFMAKDGENTSV
jgi:hypothetical protein